MTPPVSEASERTVQNYAAPASSSQSGLLADEATARARWDEWLMYASMALLLLSTVQEVGLISHALKLLWLGSVALLTIVNIGAAVGMYIAAAAVFAVLSYDSWGSIFERPDNYALLLVAGALSLRILSRRPVRWWHPSILVIGGFVAYALMQSAWLGVLNRVTIASYMRMLGLPMLMFLLIAQHGVTPRELRALVRSLLVLGGYMALISIAERVGWGALIIPAWIADPSIAPVNPARAEWTVTGRSGGSLMQAEYNGLALSLIYCIAIFGRHLGDTKRWLQVAVSLLCLVGIFYSYTRAAWVACVAGAVILLWRPLGAHRATRLRRFALVGASTTAIIAMALAPDTFARQRLGDAGTVVLRFNLWKASLAMAADRPLLGRGIRSFEEDVADYRHEMTESVASDLGDTVTHNIFLSVLVELGAIGLLLYVAALVAIVARATKGARQSWGDDGRIWIAVFTGVYLFQMQFIVLGDPAPNHLFFVMMAAIAGLQSRPATLLTSR